MHFAPTRFVSRRPSRPSAAHFIPLGLLLGVAWLGADSLGVARPDTASAVGAPGLRCTLERTETGALSVVLANRGDWRLAGGRRVVWTLLGSPQPVGEARSLPAELAPGQSLRLDTTRRGSGAGCIARLID